MKFTTPNKQTVTIYSGGKFVTSVPRGHYLWKQLGVDVAEVSGEIALFEQKINLPTPYLHQVSGEESVEIETDTLHYLEVSPTFEPLPIEEILTIKLEELKILRNKALVKGFKWGDFYANSDTDSQGAVHRRLDHFSNGMREMDAVTSYKIASGEYITFTGQSDVMEFAVAMTNFVEDECFGKEAVVAMLLADMTQEELLDVVLEDLFLPNHG